MFPSRYVQNMSRDFQVSPAHFQVFRIGFLLLNFLFRVAIFKT